MNKIFTLLLCATMVTFRLQAHDFILADSAAPSKTSLNTLSSDIIAAQEQQIRTAVLFALVPVIVAFSFIVFIFHRAKREAFFRQKKAELEVKALRAQINPHFIFNCLNSIHHYMHRHSAQLSGDYLLKFSQLMRYVLE